MHFYVNPKGDDTASGSEQYPFTHIHRYTIILLTQWRRKPTGMRRRGICPLTVRFIGMCRILRRFPQKKSGDIENTLMI